MSIQPSGIHPKHKTEQRGPLEEDAMDLDVPVSTAVKRTFEDMNSGAALLEDRQIKKTRREEDSKITFTKFERWASPKSNVLMSLLPAHAHTSDPYRLIFIDVQVGEGEWMEFRVPLMVLFQLSDYFRKEFSHRMSESETLRIKWVGPGCDRNLHPQAVAQVLMYGHRRAGVFDEDQCRTLQQLKDSFPEEYKVILSDMVRLCNYYEIEGLSEEVALFVAEELSSDLETHFPGYFEWALQNEESSAVFLSALSEMSQEDYMKLYPLLISFFNADYSECTKEQILSAKTLLRKSFEILLDEEKYEERIDPKQVSEICRCFIELYPYWEFEKDTICKVHSFASNLDERPPLVQYVCLFCNCYANYSSRLNDFRNLNKVKQASVIDLDHRPKAEGKLKAYELFLQGMAINPPNLSEFLTQYPNHIFALKLSAWMHAKSRNFVAALEELEKIIAIVPGDEQALRARAFCRWKIKDYESALKDFQTLNSLYPTSALNHIMKAEMLKEVSNFDAALAAVEPVLRTGIYHSVHRADALSVKGDCLEGKGDLEGALANYNLALLENPTHINSLLGLSKYFLEKKMLDEAKQVLDKALKSSPGSAKVFALQGRYFFLKGDLEASLIAYNKALSIEIVFLTLALKAELLLKMGQIEEALTLLERADQLRPNEPFALFLKGKCMQRIGKHEAAVECFTRVIQVNPKSISALNGRAESYQFLGNDAAALRDYDRILEIKPDLKEISSKKNKLLIFMQ